MPSRRWVSRVVLSLLVLGRGSAGADAPQSKPPRKDLTDLSLVELAELEVTSVSKRPERVSHAAAAVFVISGEDIRRSGARTLAEALRLAPGVQVARIHGNQWAIGVRGFGSRLSRSLLVLVDGRSVYSPLFAGTYWEVQDTVLEDVDRIEVIRGPGGAIWGSNAVAGVINIITRSARDTPGLHGKVGGGTEERIFGTARYGLGLGDAGAVRVYGKYNDRGPQLHAVGEPPYDSWHLTQGGFRADLAGRDKATATLSGDVYSGHLGEQVTYGLYAPPYAVTDDRQAHVSGGNVLARGTRELAAGGSLTAQVSWDRTTRSEANLSEARSTLDAELRHVARLPLSQELMWGLGYRVSTGEARGVATVIFDPARKTDRIFNVFFQDRLPLLSGRLTLVAGAKLEHNDYSGWELQPNLRLVATPDAVHTVWAAVSRAVRTPTRLDEDLSLTIPASPQGPAFARFQGSHTFEAERVLAYEAGWRAQPAASFWVDTSLFFNRHTNLLSLEPGAPYREGAFTIFPYLEANRVRANVWGVELAAEAALTSSWRLQAAYAYLRMDVHPEAGSLDTTQAAQEGQSPRNQVSLISSFNLPADVEFDLWFRFVDRLSAFEVPGYATADLRVGWTPLPELRLSVVGQNLFQPGHAEFGAPAGRVEIRRGVYAEASLRW